MRLSELVDRCSGHDPFVLIEDDEGIPVDVADVDLGVASIDGVGSGTCVILVPTRSER